MSSGYNNSNKGGALVLIARILLVVEAAALALMCLNVSSILPMRRLGIIIGICVLVIALQIVMVAGGRRYKGRSIASILLSIALCVVSVLVMMFMRNIHTSLEQISETTRQENKVVSTQTINVYVRKADGLKLMTELAGRNIGILEAQDTRNTDLALNQLEAELGEPVQTVGFPGILLILKGLENGEADAILVNSMFASALTENDPAFLEWAELLGTIDITKEQPVDETEEVDTPVKTTTVKPVENVANNAFLIYLTGMDTISFEGVSELGNSDVNMIAAVNPTTKQILLVNIPRDYYWYLWGDESYPDKITHSGYYGVDCSIETMSTLFDMDINYYVKVGYSSVVNIVDAIGGITVWSDYEFEQDGVYINVGENYLDGYSALQFARQRYSLPGGDRARGVNQQTVIKAIFEKVTSAEMLPRFSEVLSIITSNVITSLPPEDLEKIMKMTLDGTSGWNIQSCQVDGAGSWGYCFSLGDENDIMIPDWDTVETAKGLLTAVLNGEYIELTQEDEWEE
ncbi:MAG: LCP family protein [Lachnospiraceae bacterium]|nr:LCP family protein [Lachnospiraceae bacterium]